MPIPISFTGQKYFRKCSWKRRSALFLRPSCGSSHGVMTHNATSEEFENTALFQRLGLPLTLIRHENGAFRKRSSNRRNLKRRLCVFVWTEDILKMELSENDYVTIST